jgi:glycosyltransferase involved in cell wall biosynthesis
LRLVVLASIAPDFRHFRAGQTVLAEIIEALSIQGVQLTVALAGHQNDLDGTQVARLELKGITIADSQSFNINHEFKQNQLKWKIRQVRSVLQSGKDCDFFGFIDPDKAADEIADLKPDAVLLFWDTYFEHILPNLIHRGIECFAYSAKPRQASGLSSLGTFKSTMHKLMQRLQLNAAQKRHVERYKLLKDSRNICDLDCSWYARQGVHVKYLSNTWPDPYGEDWQQKRLTSESKRAGVNILANIGGLNATGNTFGLQYLADKIMPILINKMSREWAVNICGRFEMPKYLKEALKDPHVKLLGFVDDIDDEVIGNEIFMLLNNAGPFTGGYTRVMYAFSAGACLVGHSKLSLSTPELVSGQNCLLADTPEEIAEYAMRAARDPALRLQIGTAARQTYDEYFKPSTIAREIRQMIESGISNAK